MQETPEPKTNKKKGERNQMVRWNDGCQGAWKDKKNEYQEPLTPIPSMEETIVNLVFGSPRGVYEVRTVSA